MFYQTLYQTPADPRQAQLQRLLNSMTTEQRTLYLKSRATQETDAELQRATYLPATGAMQPNANQAAAQHQRQIYEQQMAQRSAALEHQLAQRRARKPTDRNMPEGIEDLVIGDGVQQYKDLRDVEKKLDYAMMRKRLDIQDTVNRNVKRQKTMRIWISNTVENQPWQRPALDENSFDFNSGADSTYKVKLEGKILDEPEEDILVSDDEDQDQDMDVAEESKNNKKRPQNRHKFSHYFKALSVEFDKTRSSVNPNPNIDPSMQIEWKKNSQSAEFDCLEFTRKGDENLNITINLVRDEQVERYRLSQALAGTLDMEEADRAEVVMGIWEYVKAMGLQEDEERRLVRCDERLKGVRCHLLCVYHLKHAHTGC
jgi:SWI/SNF-related matrix-associated actin-dependent regulator of chromatin subfamily D